MIKACLMSGLAGPSVPGLGERRKARLRTAVQLRALELWAGRGAAVDSEEPRS